MRTTTTGPLNTVVTTQEWLDQYLNTLRFNTQFRGKPKTKLDGDHDDSSAIG